MSFYYILSTGTFEHALAKRGLLDLETGSQFFAYSENIHIYAIAIKIYESYGLI